MSQTKLLNALSDLVRAANDVDFPTQKDNMILDPQALNSSCSYSLFSSEDLTRLRDMILLQQGLVSCLNRDGYQPQGVHGGEYDVPPSDKECQQQKAIGDGILQIPPPIVAHFGRVFVEIVMLVMSPRFALIVPAI